MKYLFTLLLGCSFVCNSFGQDPQKIEHDLNKCLLDSAGEYGRQVCYKLAIEKYDQLIAKLADQISSHVPKEQAEEFRQGQEHWRHFRKSETHFYSRAVFTKNSQALMNGTNSLLKEYAMVRDRSIELTELLKILTTKE